MAYTITNPYYYHHVIDEKRITRIRIKVDEKEVDSSHVMDKIELSYNHANQDFTVGQVLFSTTTLKVINTLQIENNSTIEITIGLKVYNDEILEWEWVDVPFFTGEVYDIKLGETFNTVEFYSVPIQLLQQNYVPRLTNYTTRSLLIEMALELGIVVEDLEIIPTATIDVDDKIRTGLEWLNIISTLLTMNVYIGRNGEINLVSINPSAVLDVACPSSLMGASPSRGQYPYNIQQVIIQNGDNSDDIITAGIDCPKENQIKLNNPFATQSTANNILNALKLVRYNAFKFKWYHCPLHLDPLDFIQVDYKGEMLVIPVMNLKFTYSNGGLNCEIDTTVSNSTNKNSDFKGSLSTRLEIVNKITNDLSTKVEIVDGKVETLISETTIVEEDGSQVSVKDKVSQLTQSVDGLATTVTETNLRIDTEVDNLINGSQQILDLVNQIADDDNITEADRANFDLVINQITLEYNAVSREVTKYDVDYFINFMNTLTTQYNTVVNLYNPIQQGATTGAVELRNAIISYYDAYHNLLYTISAYTKDQLVQFSTQIEQTAKDVTTTISRLEVVEGVSTQVNNHMRFSDDWLELYSTMDGTNSAFKARLSNTQLSFYDGDTVVAYISNKTLNIENAIVHKDLRIGDMILRPSVNGGIVMQYDK